jgi:hypothetical protein
MRRKTISLGLAALLALAPACAPAEVPVAALERERLTLKRAAAASTHELHLTLATLEGGRWTRAEVLALAEQAARILAQCDVALASVELVRIGAPARFRDYATGPARELARALPLERPTVYFVADTRQRPAFDAEAIGRANSRSRPELTDTVWMTRATRDPGIALAHELVHVLMDSGEHSEEDENLMREETAPRNVRLNAAQCARLRATGSAHGLLRPTRQ